MHLKEALKIYACIKVYAVRARLQLTQRRCTMAAHTAPMSTFEGSYTEAVTTFTCYHRHCLAIRELSY